MANFYLTIISDFPVLKFLSMIFFSYFPFSLKPNFPFFIAFLIFPFPFADDFRLQRSVFHVHCSEKLPLLFRLAFQPFLQFNQSSFIQMIQAVNIHHYAFCELSLQQVSHIIGVRTEKQLDHIFYN